jgi:hypothetical protein
MNANGSGTAKVTDDAFADFQPDWQPANSPYVRPKGATPLRASLVIAYRPCVAPNNAHGAPLAFQSCSPPVQASDYLTIGTPPQEPAGSVGSVLLRAMSGNRVTPANEADVRIAAGVTDVRQKVSLADYSGELQAILRIRITDRNNAPPVNGSGTVSDTSIAAAVPCSATEDTTVGSTCAIATSVNTLVPGAVVEGKRAIWELGKIDLFDGGADGVASTTAGNTLFETQGVFVP